MKRRKRERGIAMVIVILVSVVALGAIVAATSVAALSSRQVTRFENAATVALMAAESGHNALEARARLPEYAFDRDRHGTIAGWLTAELGDDGFSFSEYELPGGAIVQMRAIGNELTGLITIESVGIAPGRTARRVLLKDYVVVAGLDFSPRYSDAALVTKTQLKSRSQPSSLRGLSTRWGDWVFDGPLSSARLGEYVLFGGTKSGDTVSGGVTYRVEQVNVNAATGRPDAMTLVRLEDGSATEDTVECVFTGGLLDAGASDSVCEANTLIIPFAVSATGPLEEVPVLGVDHARLPVNRSTWELFEDFDFENVAEEDWPVVHFEPPGATSLSAKIVGVIEDGGRYYLDFGPNRMDLLQPGVEVTEGTPVRGTVLSAIAEGGCDVDIERDTPDGCETPPLGNLWTNTFGDITKTMLRGVAMARTDEELAAVPLLSQEHYDHWRKVNRAYYGGGSWPSSVDGLTWIDGAKTRGFNNRLCGSGIVVLNTGSELIDFDDDNTPQINLTTQDCFFSGVIYIIGQLKLVGNLSNFAGVVYVEGPGGITEMQGTGRGGVPGANPKSLYNAISVRDAFGLLPGATSIDGLFGGIDESIRLGTVRP